MTGDPVLEMTAAGALSRGSRRTGAELSLPAYSMTLIAQVARRHGGGPPRRDVAASEAYDHRP